MDMRDWVKLTRRPSSVRVGRWPRVIVGTAAVRQRCITSTQRVEDLGLHVRVHCAESKAG